MPGKLRYLLAFLFSATSVTALLAQTKTNNTELTRMSNEFRIKQFNEYARALQIAKQKGWFVRKNTVRGGVVALVGVDELGNPKYVGTVDNLIAAATTRANQLWPGGSSGLGLSGSSASVKGKIGIWDGGHALTTHVELVGRILVKDNSALSDHATHTTGTLIATGINPIAKGMAFQTQQLISYDFDNDLTTMAAEASSLIISNHSYGFLSGSGWSYDGTNWDWYGDTTISKSQGYGFGYYDQNSQIYDSIAYNAPFYLISVAAGNPRAYNGPPVDSPYLYNGNQSLKRTATLANNPTYTSVCNTSDAKNIIVVGAVNGIPAGYSSPADVVMSDFSAWGPTNDGRIKPDIVADGVNVTSTWSTSNTAYQTESGTSMATPNVTGSLYLLQEYYTKLHPASFMRSATLKGLAIHTADEAGPSEGPDYEFGWGLLDVLKGANVITSSFNHQTDTIIESALNSTTNTYTFTAVASGKGGLVATLSWTDPAATPVPVILALHNTTSMLVNDLDMRITTGTQTFMPWILDPANPSNPATRGDNFRDNVEKINVDSVTPGQTYTITITHKGILARGQQAFSLLVSGIGGQPYCTSAPTSSAGTRIDSVNFSNLHNANPPGCTTYTNYTNLTAQIQPNQKLPISIKLSSCDASTASKVVKVYIDYNNNGVFDSNELAAQSPVLSGNVTYNDTIITPGNLTLGNYTTMRIVAEETTDPTTVLPCGTYGKGETEDYRILIVNPAVDVALSQIISPASGDCGDTGKIVVVGIRNTGTDTVANVPVSVVISNGSTTVSTINEIYPGTIPPGFLVTYAFQQTFNAAQGSTYNVNAYVKLSNDQNSSNDTMNSVVITATEPGTPAATASVSGDTVTLKVTNADPTLNYFWYASDTSDNPLFATIDTIITLNSIPTGNAFYVGTGINTNIGVKTKNVYPNGGGYQAGGGNWLSYTSQIPLTLNSAKLYTGNPGKVTIMVVDTITVNGEIDYFVPALSSTTIDVYATSKTPDEGSRNNDPNDNGAVFYINLPLPVGKHVIMDTTVDASVDKTAVDDATIFRNNNVTGNPYPFNIGNVFSITGNSATSSTNPDLFQSYYYYLYNMKLETSDCLSSRTKVLVSVPANIAFNVWPNPTHGSFTILMNTNSAANVEVQLFDLLGRRCFSENYSANGIFSTQISTGTLVTGMYILSVKYGSNTYTRKLLILK